MIPCHNNVAYADAEFDALMTSGDRKAWCTAWLALQAVEGTGLPSDRNAEVANTFGAYKAMVGYEGVPEGVPATCSGDREVWEEVFAPLTLAECGGGGDCGYYVLNRIMYGEAGDPQHMRDLIASTLREFDSTTRTFPIAQNW